MAASPDEKRIAAWVELMQKLSSEGQAIGITKADLRAAVDAIDNFLESNVTAINNAFPQPSRSSLTTAQKARILAAVTLYRYGDIS